MSKRRISFAQPVKAAFPYAEGMKRALPAPLLLPSLPPLPSLTLVGLGLLVGCAPAPLRAQADAALRVQARLTTPAVQTVTGEELYRQPGPGALRVWSDRPAFITTVFVPPSGRVEILPAGQVQAGETVTVGLPATLGFTQVFTVASLQPMDLTAAQGASSLNQVAQVVEAQARTMPRGSYTVATTSYRVSTFGSMRVGASQPGAEVRVNGRLAGYAPLVISDLPEGEVNVQVSRNGFVTANQRVNIQANVMSDVQVNLRPITGTLVVKSNVSARVLVEQRAAGRVAPNAPLSIPIRPGTVGVNVLPDDSALRPATILMRIKASSTLVLTCTASNGSLDCRTE